MLAYASDLTLLDSADPAPPGIGMTDGFRSASLDHAMWFHRPFRVDEWLLYVQDSPSPSARAASPRRVYTRAGELVASVAQEGLIRLRG